MANPTAATYKDWILNNLNYLFGGNRGLIESKYKPSKASDPNTIYYTREGMDYDVVRNLLGGKEAGQSFLGNDLFYKDFNDLYSRLNGKTSYRNTDNSTFGEYTVSVGEDENGRYVSYWDKFDYVFPELFGKKNPKEFYNRIYESDFNKISQDLSNENYYGSNPSGKRFFKSPMRLMNNIILRLKQGGMMNYLDYIPKYQTPFSRLYNKVKTKVTDWVTGTTKEERDLEDKLDLTNLSSVRSGSPEFVSSGIRGELSRSNGEWHGKESDEENKLQKVKNAALWVPYVGDAVLAEEAADEAKAGNYTAAAGLGLLMAVPYGTALRRARKVNKAISKLTKEEIVEGLTKLEEKMPLRQTTEADVLKGFENVYRLTNSPEYKQRIMRELGYDEERADKLIQTLNKNLSDEAVSPSIEGISNIEIANNIPGAYGHSIMRVEPITFSEGKMVNSGKLKNREIRIDANNPDPLGTTGHEFFHALTLSVPSKNDLTHKITSEADILRYPIIYREQPELIDLIEHNDKVAEELLLPGFRESEKLTTLELRSYAREGEIEARAIAKDLGISVSDVLKLDNETLLPYHPINLMRFKAAFGLNSEKAMKRFLGGTGIIAGVGIGASAVETKKQGGTMNILDYLKEGSQIHIKKKNRGKFTDYCGGKVTAECIARGKKSPSATIRKRATFAANARKWNHEDGGILKALDGIQFLSLNRTDLKRLNETDEEWKNRVNAIMNAGNIDTDDIETSETVGPTASSSDRTTSTTTDWTTQYRATGGNETPTTSPQQTTTQTSVATVKPDMSKVRSDRNNNPLNIRFTNIAWLGKKTEGKSDNDFEEFESRDYGWRAAYKNLETKMKRGLNTITKLVSEWAPPSENNTNGYIQFVALKTGIDPNAVITRADLPKIGAAMAAVESGRRNNIDWDDAMRGFKFYLGQPV